MGKEAWTWLDGMFTRECEGYCMSGIMMEETNSSLSNSRLYQGAYGQPYARASLRGPIISQDYYDSVYPSCRV